MSHEQEWDFEGSQQSIIVAISSFAVHFLFLGFIYSFGVYQEALVEYFDSVYGSVSWIGTTMASMLIITGPFSGWLTDRMDNRKLCCLGAILFSCSLVGASYAKSIWELYISMGLFSGLGISLSYYPTVATVSDWWIRRRGSANSFAAAGAGAGGLTLAPLTQFLIRKYDWQTSLRITVAVMGPLMLLVSLALFPRERWMGDPIYYRNDETDDGVTAMEERRIIDTSEDDLVNLPLSASKIIASEVNEVGFRDWFSQLFNRKFICLLLAYFCESFAYFVPFFYICAYCLQEGYSHEVGGLALGLLNGANGLGRLVFVRIGDRCGYFNSLLFCLIISTTSLYVWTVCVVEWSILLFVLFFGFHVGGYISLQASMLATLFEPKQIAGVVGILYSSGVPGTLLGPVLAGHIIDNRNNFNWIIYFTAILFSIEIAFLIPVWFSHHYEEKVKEMKGGT